MEVLVNQPFVFQGNQFFNFNLPIDGWNQMTVFLVAKSAVDPLSGSWPSESAAIFWNENASSGEYVRNSLPG